MKYNYYFAFLAIQLLKIFEQSNKMFNSYIIVFSIKYVFLVPFQEKVTNYFV